MKLAEIKRQRSLLKSLSKASQRDRIRLIKNMDDESIKFLTQCIGGVIHGNSPYFKMKKQHLKEAGKQWQPYKSLMLKISEPSQLMRVTQQIKKKKKKGGATSKEGEQYTNVVAAMTPLVNALARDAIQKNDMKNKKNKK